MKIEFISKTEFSKKLLVLDYLILMVLFLCLIFTDKDLSGIVIAWIAQTGISSTAYYWKAKCENRTKVPFKVIESLPEDMREKIDLTQIITSIIQHE